MFDNTLGYPSSYDTDVMTSVSFKKNEPLAEAVLPTI